jgi:hypothetical protein
MDSGTIVIKACAALNGQITCLNYSIGRVAGMRGYGSLENNIAYAGMTLNDATVTPGSDDTGAGNNGASKTAAQLETESTWTSLFGSGSFGASDSAPWVWDSAAKRPKLYWRLFLRPRHGKPNSTNDASIGGTAETVVFGERGHILWSRRH